MGFWSWMGRVVGLPDTPRHTFSADPVTVWSPADGPVDWTVLNLAGGLTVGRTEALSVANVLRGRNLLCSIATLPLRLADREHVPQEHPLFAQFDPNVPNVVHLAMTIEDLIFESIAWWRVTSRTWDNYPATVERIDPARVTVDPSPATPPVTLPSGKNVIGGTVRIDGRRVEFRDVIRFDSPNPGLLRAARGAVQRALLLDAAAAMYAGEPPPREFFTSRDGLDPEEDAEIKAFLDDWTAARQRRTVGFVPSQYERHDANGLSPAELQLAELQKSAGLAIANAIGVDPEELGISTTSRTYANAVDRRRDKINDVYAPYMRAITDRLSMGDVTKRGYHALFTLDDYMKANPTERVGYYQAMKAMGVMDESEIRAAEGLPPHAAQTDDDDTDSGGTVTALPARGVAASHARAGHTFADDGPVHIGFSDPEVHHFAVDTESRTITGLAVPYNKVGRKYGMKFRYKPGSLKYSDVGRIKHFKDHVVAVGKHLSITETKDGPVVKMSVVDGPTGDELLALAAAGVYDGLSVGAEFSLDPADGDIVEADDGVWDVINATWRETTTTALPAFDDARVTKVAASAHPERNTMKCATCQTEHAPNVACPTTPPVQKQDDLPEGFTADDVKKFHTLATFFGVDAKLPDKPAPGPSIVDPTKQGPRTQVNEASPYRFDSKGNLCKGTHEFSADIVAAQRGDVAATERVTEFVRHQFAVATGDVSDLNPSQNRPEMYVDQRQFRYPMWDAIRKGTLDDITPFYFPKFNTATGLVGDHTEGVEPTSGTFTTTNQTVTPTAISGKAEINRETWDQGGTPQVSNLIWTKMLQGWFEALEAFAAATLDAATPTAIALTTGAEDDVLVDELTLELALLNFVRGGFSMDVAFTQVDLYKRLVAAKATDGRKLLPALSPANADGQTRARWSGLDVNGVAFLPAWALAASGAVVASSYLFDSQSVWGWATTPQRLEFQYQTKSVEIAIWGYKASAITDLAGVREITYDPTV